MSGLHLPKPRVWVRDLVSGDLVDTSRFRDRILGHQLGTPDTQGLNGGRPRRWVLGEGSDPKTPDSNRPVELPRPEGVCVGRLWVGVDAPGTPRVVSVTLSSSCVGTLRGLGASLGAGTGRWSTTCECVFPDSSSSRETTRRL